MLLWFLENWAITRYDAPQLSCWLPFREVMNGHWCALNLTVQQSVSGGGHYCNQWFQHGCLSMDFFTSSHSIYNQVSSYYLEEVSKWKLTNQLTQQHNLLFLFLFHMDIQAEAYRGQKLPKAKMYKELNEWANK